MEEKKDKLKEFWAGKSLEQVESSLHLALNILMVVEFLFAVGGYIFLKTYVSQLWAELLMLVLFTIELYSNVGLVESTIKQKISQRIGKVEENGSEEKQQDNKEDNSLESKVD